MGWANYMSACNSIVGLYLWCHISYHDNAKGPQKRPLNFSFCKLSEETNSVTYRFYFFVKKFPKFFNFSDSMEKKLSNRIKYT